MLQHQHEVGPAERAPAPRRVGRGPTTASALVHARAMLHGGQPERMFAALDAIEHELRDDERWEAALLRGAALVALGRLDDGLAALRPALRSGNERVRNETRCELAEAYLRAGRLDDAGTVLSPFLDGEGKEEPHHAARALALYGRMERARGRRVVAGRYFLDALAALERAAGSHQGLRNALLRDVAVVAVETLEPRLFERVRARLATVERIQPEHVAIQRVRVLGELLRGDVASAWEVAFAATRFGRSGVSNVAALVDLATVSRAAGDAFTAQRLTLAAAEGAQVVDWAGADGSLRRALPGLVAALAAVDARRAAALLDLYEELPTADSTGGEHTARALARAALAGSRRRVSEQRSVLAQAATAAREDGDYHGEVEVLLELAAAGECEHALRRADELTRLVPGSWLRRRHEALERSLDVGRLSPTERRVMLAICEGLSTLAIAQRFGRSKNTIRNQTRRVYEVMEVRTRSALVAKCAALRLLPSAPSPVVSRV